MKEILLENKEIFSNYYNLARKYIDRFLSNEFQDTKYDFEIVYSLDKPSYYIYYLSIFEEKDKKEIYVEYTKSDILYFSSRELFGLREKEVANFIDRMIQISYDIKNEEISKTNSKIIK